MVFGFFLVVSCVWIVLCMLLRTYTVFFRLGAYTVSVAPVDENTWVVNSSRCICRVDGGISRRILLTVPRMVEFRLSSRFASDSDVKKLSVVTFLPLSKNGSVSLMTTLSDTLSPWGRVGSLPRYGRMLQTYLVFKSHATQNLIPNLSGLDAMYCRKQQRVLHGKSCSSMVMCWPGM